MSAPINSNYAARVACMLHLFILRVFNYEMFNTTALHILCVMAKKSVVITVIIFVCSKEALTHKESYVWYVLVTSEDGYFPICVYTALS